MLFLLVFIFETQPGHIRNHLQTKRFLAMVQPLIVDMLVRTSHQSGECIKHPFPHEAIVHTQEESYSLVCPLYFSLMLSTLHIMFVFIGYTILLAKTVPNRYSIESLFLVLVADTDDVLQTVIPHVGYRD